MNKKGISYFTSILFLLLLFVGVAATTVPDFDLDNFKSSLNWTDIELEEVEHAPDLGNALESFINGLGEGLFSLAKWMAELAIENPQVPFKLFLITLLFSIFAPFLLVLFKFTVIIVILIKEFVQQRREKQHGI